MLRNSAVALFMFIACSTAGQNMSFGTGTLTVAQGTTVVLQGPIAWQLAADAQVVNNGTIDFGATATLVETVGAPITGDGTERAFVEAITPLAATEPGGLGFIMTIADGGGGITVERGHLPRTVPNGTSSIARWYGLSTLAPTSDPLNFTLRYDPTELNGIDPALLSVFAAPASSGSWLPLATTADLPSQTLAATDQAPWDYFTAFDLEAALTIQEGSAADIRVWPTFFNEYIDIRSTQPIDLVELIDATGRSVWSERLSGRPGSVRLTPGLRSAGAYLLRVNNNATFHLMHP